MISFDPGAVNAKDSVSGVAALISIKACRAGLGDGYPPLPKEIGMAEIRRVHIIATGLLLSLLLALVVVLMVPRAAHGQSSSPAQGVARGERIVQQKCSRCHATGRADQSPNPKAPPFRDVGKNYPPEHLAEALAEGIITGDNEMPEFKFGPQDVDAIIDYLAAMAASNTK
jgi:cytochrome c